MFSIIANYDDQKLYITKMCICINIHGYTYQQS